MLRKKSFWFGFIPGLLLLIETTAFLTTAFPARTEGEGFLVLILLMCAFTIMTATVFMLLPFKPLRTAAYGLTAPLVLAYASAAILNIRLSAFSSDYTGVISLLAVGFVVLLSAVATALLSRRRRRSNNDDLALTVHLK